MRSGHTLFSNFHDLRFFSEIPHTTASAGNHHSRSVISFLSDFLFLNTYLCDAFAPKRVMHQDIKVDSKSKSTWHFYMAQGANFWLLHCPPLLSIWPKVADSLLLPLIPTFHRICFRRNAALSDNVDAQWTLALIMALYFLPSLIGPFAGCYFYIFPLIMYLFTSCQGLVLHLEWLQNIITGLISVPGFET